MAETSHTEPRVIIRAERVSPAGEPGRWIIQWAIENQTRAAIEAVTIRIPHDQFWAEDQTLSPPLRVSGESTAILSSKVRCTEPAGSTLTYPFMIIQCRWLERDWRLFSRLRIETDTEAVPHPVCEETTAQAVGSRGT